LSEEGYRVITARNGEQAVDEASKSHPNLVLLDIVMPRKDGLATLRELKEKGERGPVIMLTGHGTIGTAREAMMLGAHGYITKPYDLELLKRALLEGLQESGLKQGDGACAP